MLRGNTSPTASESARLVIAPLNLPRSYGSVIPYYRFMRNTVASTLQQSLHRSESMVSLACFRTLINYITDDNVDGLQSYFSTNKNALVDDKDENGSTALMVACEKGSAAMVSVLLANGADPRAQDADGWGPLALATKRGTLDIVNELLRHSADVSHRDMGGWTAFMWACYKGHAEIVDALAAAGADPNAAGMFGVSALMWAAGRSHGAAAERALAAGAKATAADRHGTTALVWASRAGCIQSVRALLRHGAASAIDAPGMYSWTPLLQATMGNHFDIVQMLLEHKPNLNALDKDGCTALTLACKEGFYDIAVALIAAGAYINIQDRDGDTCLIHATKGGHKAIVEALLKRYADVDALGKDRKTAIYTAVEKGHTSIVKLLLQSNPDLESATKDGDTPLLRAVRTRNAEIVQMLVDKKARIQATDKRGDTALHIAMRARSKAIVEILLRNPKHSQLLYRPNRQQETPYNIDLSYPKTILGQIFGARKLNTNEDNENMLGYGLYSSALADMLSEPSLSVPITVGIYARWGSGKSFLLNKLKEEMKTFAKQWSWQEGGADLSSPTGKGMAGGWAAWWAGAHAAIATTALATAAAGVGWGNALAAAAGILFVLTLFGALLKFTANKYDWYWSQALVTNLTHKFDSLKLVLQIMFCHPPGPQSTLNLPAQPIRFHFTDQAKGSTQEGEASVIQMIVSLSEALESQYGKLCTRLYRAFRPKPIRATASWRWRRVCCIPHIVAFELCFLCAVVGLSALILFLMNKNADEQSKQIQQGIFIGVGGLVSLIAIANIYTWGRMGSALFFSPRAHVKRSIRKQPEGFLQALRPEVLLLTEMVACLDAFTGQQTRLVVVVDALDSCEQDRVLVVLNALHSLCSESQSPFIVLLAIDPHIISKAVEVNSRRAFAESNIGGWDYLRNMVQLPFYLQNSTLRRVDIARHAAIKRFQGLNEDFTLQRSVSVRRLSSASEIMSSQERIKPVSNVVSGGNTTTNAASSRTRRLRPSESIASSIASGLHRLTGLGGPSGAGTSVAAPPAPTAGDLSRVLLTDDYFSDVNPRSMRRLMNVIYVTGRLLKAFNIDFNYYSLASWINLTEQWPFRTSWIIFHYESFEEHIDDSTPLKHIYEKVRPNMPTLRDAEPLMDLDRDERKLDIFLGVHRTNLLVADLKVFLPFTINLDPYLKKVIKDEQHQQNTIEEELSTLPFMTPLAKGASTTSKMYQLQHRKQKFTAPVNPTPPWVNWIGSPPQFQQSLMQQLPHFQQFQTPFLQQNTALGLQPGPLTVPADTTGKDTFAGLEELSDVRLSQLTVDGVCDAIERALGATRSTAVAPSLKQHHICGRVLACCDLVELKQVLNLNFGDWELLKMLILSMRDNEATMPRSAPVTVSSERGLETEKESKQRPSLETQRSKPSNMEKQVTLEEQMICGALQTLNEEAMEDVMQGDSSVPDEDGELQSMFLAPSSSAVWQNNPGSPPESSSNTPHLPRKMEAPILRTSASFKSTVKKHVHINEHGFNFGSQHNLKNGEIPGITFRYEDDSDIQNEPITLKLDKATGSSTNDTSATKHLKSNAKQNILHLNVVSDLKSDSSSIDFNDTLNQNNLLKRTTKFTSSKESKPRKLHSYLSRRSKSLKRPTRQENAIRLSNFSRSADNAFVQGASDCTAGIHCVRSSDKLLIFNDKIFPSSGCSEALSGPMPDRLFVESDDEAAPLVASRMSSLSLTSTKCTAGKDTEGEYTDYLNRIHRTDRTVYSDLLGDDSENVEATALERLVSQDKCLDVECVEYGLSKVSPSVEFSPTSEASTADSINVNCDGKILPLNTIVDEIHESTLKERSHLKEANNALLHRTESDGSLSDALESYQPTSASPGSDCSLRSALWRQNALDCQDDRSNPESSV